MSLVKLLNEGLADALRDHIEQLVQPIFMPRNEEEVIKNILLLANQLKYVNDLPQVMITFDEQTDEHLSFTVILLRVLKGKVKPIDELFKPVSAGIRFVHEQSKVVGKVRKRYPKEANVFRLQIGKEDFFRTNNSLDFYRARQEIYSYLENIIGEVRDFNGGLISKQNEKLNVLKNDLGDIGNYNLLLLENFFYSITPSIMRNLLEVMLFR